MRKLRQLFILGLVAFTFFNFTASKKYRFIKNTAFKTGEHIEYLVHYGPFNAGTAEIDLNKKVYLVNNRVCYRVDVKGTTMGMAGALVEVNDTWRTYIDTSAFISHRFYRNIEEGTYRRKELTNMNPLNQTAVMKYEQYSTKDNNKKRETKTFKIPQFSQDMISGYYYIRTMDFSKMKAGDVITVPGLLEDYIYNLKIRYQGLTTIKTKYGKMKVHKLAPIMPENSLFKGEDSIRFFVTDDKNKVPVRVEADMFIGKVVCEIKNYRGLKHKLGAK